WPQKVSWSASRSGRPRVRPTKRRRTSSHGSGCSSSCEEALGVWRSAFGVRRLALGVWRAAWGVNTESTEGAKYDSPGWSVAEPWVQVKNVVQLSQGTWWN